MAARTTSEDDTEPLNEVLADLEEMEVGYIIIEFWILCHSLIASAELSSYPILAPEI